MKRLYKWLLTGVVLLVMAEAFWPALEAQYGSEPQAESPEEYDQYLALSASNAPLDFLSSASTFEKTWPHSALLALVYERELQAYMSLGDVTNAQTAGEKVLGKLPDNLRVMADLAYLVADTYSEKTQLARAEYYGQRVLERIPTFQIPRSISPAEWTEIRTGLERKAHTALGLVAYKEGKLDQAAKDFETALTAGSQEDPSLRFRLGAVYRLMGHSEQARENLERASQSTEPEIRRRALKELEKLGAPK